MVSIGALRYDIIADTTKFTAGMVATRRELSAAKQIFLETRTPAEKLGIEMEGLNRIFKKGGIDQATYSRAMKQLKSDMHIAQGGVRGTIEQFRRMPAAVGAAVKGFVAYRAAGAAMGQIRGGLNLAMELESMQSAFNVMTGSAKEGMALMEQLKGFDLRTTFTFGQTTGAAQKLLGFGIAAQEIEPTLSRLGDISRGNADALGGLTLAYGQVATKGRLQMEEVNQMIERGFNPLNMIMQRTGESGMELSTRMQKGKVSFEELRLAVIDATSAGGRFFGLMEGRAKTTAGQLDLLAGKWENLKRNLVTDSGGLSLAGGAASAGSTGLDFLTGDTGLQKGIGSFTETTFNKLFGAITGVDTIGDTWGTMKTHAQEQNEQAAIARAKADAAAKVKADAEYAVGFQQAQEGIAGIFGSVKDTAMALINAPAEALRNAQTVQGMTGAFRDYITNPNLAQQQELRKPAPVELSPSARRGSREEYALIAKMTASKANDAEARRHNELIKKQDEQIDLWDTAVGYLGTLANAAGGSV